MNIARTIKSTFAAGVFSMAMLGGMSPASAQVKGDPVVAVDCYTVISDKTGSVIYVSLGDPPVVTAYGPDEAAYADGKELITKLGLAECKTPIDPATIPAIPVAAGAVAVTLLAGKAIKARRK